MSNSSTILTVAVATLTAVVVFWKIRRKSKKSIDKKEFGQPIRNSDFLFSDDMTFLNHGSFGGVPRPVFNFRQELLQEVELDPDRFYDHDAVVAWQKSISKVANFVESSPENLTFVSNTTSGEMIALQSLNLKESDGILITNLTHIAVQHTAKDVSQRTGAKLHCIEFTFPITSKQVIIDKYRQKMDNTPEITVAIIDHVTSPTAVRMPIEELVQLCRERHIKSVIDGAHAPGHIPLELDKLGASFYAGNMHKWAFTPRGCALFWVNPEMHNQARPFVVSHGYGKGFQTEFFYQATRDFSSHIAAGAAVDYIQELGGMSEISKYNGKLCDEAADYILKQLKTSLLNVPDEMRAPFLRVFKVPEGHEFEKTAAGAIQLRTKIITEYKINILIFAVQNELWCRFGTHIYNQLSDVAKLVQALRKICNMQD